jgi:hypothetical protein
MRIELKFMDSNGSGVAKQLRTLLDLTHRQERIARGMNRRETGRGRE